MRGRVMLLGGAALGLSSLTGCLWIDDEEHDARLLDAGSTTTVPTDTETTDSGLPPLDLDIDPLPSFVGACGEDGQLRGSVDGAWLGDDLEATLTVGPLAGVPVTLRLEPEGDRAGFVVTVPFDERLACDADGCSHPVVVAVGDVSDQVQVDFLPESEPVVEQVLADGLAVGEGADVTIPADARLTLTLSDPRMGEAYDDVVVTACPVGGTPGGSGCVDLARTVDLDEVAEVGIDGEELQAASCTDDAIQALDLYVSVETVCGDAEVPALRAATFFGDCDGDGALFADDCNDFSGDQLPGGVEACDDLDRDCNGDPYDVVTYTSGGLSMTAPRTGLPTALAAADMGSIVSLCGGTYEGTVDLPGGVTLVGVQDGTTLDGGGNGPVVDAELDLVSPPLRPSVGLQNLTITGGSTSDGGGVKFAFVVATLSDVVIEGNDAARGGGIYAEASTVDLVRTTVQGNMASNSGGGAYFQGGDLSMEDSHLMGNTSDGEGGGLVLIDVGATLDAASSIAGNSGDVGGGVALVAETFPTTLDGGTVSGNMAPDGAGLATRFSSETITVTTALENNVADNAGGAMRVFESTVVYSGSWDSNAALEGSDGYVGTNGELRLECAMAMGVTGFANTDGVAIPIIQEPCQTLGATGGWASHSCTCSPQAR